MGRRDARIRTGEGPSRRPGAVLDGVWRWWECHRDVVLRGAPGTGKTAVLEALIADPRTAGRRGVLVRAGGRRPFAALMDQPSVPDAARDESALVDWLTDELATPGSVLLLDDVDRMDQPSLAVAVRAIRRSQCRFVVSTSIDPLRVPGGHVRAVLGERAPVVVTIPPHGLRAMSALLASHLGAPIGADSLAVVMAQSGGNPRTALALVDTARAHDALREVDGVWVDDGRLAGLPADVVAYQYLPRLDGGLVDALERLAVAGALPVAAAERLCGADVVVELVDRGLVVGGDAASTCAHLAVGPPALARALRERLRPYRRARLARRIRQVTGLPTAVEGWAEHPDPGASPNVAVGEEHGRSTADLVTLVREHRAHRAPDDRRVPVDLAVRPADDPRDRAVALLAAGRPDLALRVCDTRREADLDPAVRGRLAAVRGESLLLLGRLDEAEAWQRRQLQATVRRLDASGIRLHASVLAQVLIARGDRRAAWRVLTLSLRLGAPGPIGAELTGTSSYQRTLALAAVLLAHAGDTTLARVLVHGLEVTSVPDEGRSLHALGNAALAVATGDHELAADTAWRAGQEYADRGLVLLALTTWALGPPLPPAGVTRLRALQERAHVPLFDPYVRLHVALGDRDRDDLEDALDHAHASLAPTLVTIARRTLDGARGPGPDGRPDVARLPVPIGRLSAREREIALLGRVGLSNKEIARRLTLSVRTVENHMSRAMRKLDCPSRTELPPPDELTGLGGSLHG